MNSFLGKGPAFPFERTSGGNFKMLEGHELVESCIEHTIKTLIGKRPMLKNIGTELNKLLFMLEGPARDALAKQIISDALNDFEPRIYVLEIKIEESENENEIYISILYQIIKENNPRNMVVTYNGGNL